jgi:cytochrome c oxidase assembly factor CtaG
MGSPMIHSGWHLNYAILLLVLALCCVYYYAGRFRELKSTRIFCAVMIMLFVIECSPLHDLAMQVYFSAHMIIHVLLLLVFGPLLFMSVPQRLSPVAGRWMHKCSVFLSKYTWVAWLTGVGIMWFWHIPAVFDMAMQANAGIHALLSILQTLSLLLAGIIFSWPVIGPLTGLRMHPLTGIIYLASACASCSLLGLLITFAPPGTYHYYAEMKMAYNPWHLTVGSDQQAAGLIMWVPCCFVYLTGCLWVLTRWFAGGDKIINDVNLLSQANGNRK